MTGLAEGRQTTFPGNFPLLIRNLEGRPHQVARHDMHLPSTRPPYGDGATTPQTFEYRTLVRRHADSILAST